jgi:hypothetical protein
MILKGLTIYIWIAMSCVCCGEGERRGYSFEEHLSYSYP